MTPEASIASLFLIGSTGGGLVCSLSCGRSILTAWVWIGMVMINMMSRTSMTSINGVVFIPIDRKSVVSGKSVSVRVDLGGRRIIKNKNINDILSTKNNQINN